MIVRRRAPTYANTVNLFSGAGGWEVGAEPLGIDPLGVEIDEAA